MTSMPESEPERERGGVIVPDWTLAGPVRALCTSRRGGVSRGPHGLAGGARGGFNLGAACGDAPGDVALNRARLRAWLPSEPHWLDQVHGTEVVDADHVPGAGIPPRADAAVSATPGVVLAVLTADCLPVLIADRDGRAVGIAHAGWRGLSAGIVERTLERLARRVEGATHWVAWLGPAIGPGHFEVGDDVLHAFADARPSARRAFAPGPAPGKHFADLFELARQRLGACGVVDVHGGGECTYSDAGRFYSFRRDRVTGRMASLIWIDGATRPGA